MFSKVLETKLLACAGESQRVDAEVFKDRLSLRGDL
jgi:hypothetical protein